MKRYALDTSVSGLAFAEVEPVASRIRAQPPGAVLTTAVTLEESLSGWYTYLRKATSPQAIERAYAELVGTVTNFAKLPILPYNLLAIVRYEGLLRLKLNVRRDDLRIAAIALVHQATVVTANLRDFLRVPGLAVEDWTQPVA
jgi:tRNA(fMet)-specific endonuclease VapC